MSGMPSNGGAAPGAGPGGTPAGLGGGSSVPDAAAKHKQLSELLRGGNTSSIANAGLNSASPQPGGMGPQLGTPLGKSPLGQGSPNNHLSPQAQKAGTPSGVAGQNNNSNTAAMGLNPTGFNQAMINNGPSHSGLLPQGGQPQPGQMMNGGLGPDAGRVRAAGVGVMQYQGAAAGAGGAGSALAETLTQGGQQMGAHPNLNGAQQAGSMNKVGDIFPVNSDNTNIKACISCTESFQIAPMVVHIANYLFTGKKWCFIRCLIKHCFVVGMFINDDCIISTNRL